MKKLAYFLLITASQLCLADWSLHNKASNFNYFSLIKEDMTVNSFSNLYGSISDQGKLVLRVDLNSIDTSNSNRDIYLQDNFLETRSFQEGELSINLGKQFLNKLEISQASQMKLQGNFKLHGIDQKLEMTLLLTRLNDNFLIIKTFQPLSIKLSDFGYSEGIERLQKLETFKNITGTVPISLNLFFSLNKTIE